MMNLKSHSSVSSSFLLNLSANSSMDTPIPYFTFVNKMNSSCNVEWLRIATWRGERVVKRIIWVRREAMNQSWANFLRVISEVMHNKVLVVSLCCILKVARTINKARPWRPCSVRVSPQWCSILKEWVRVPRPPSNSLCLLIVTRGPISLTLVVMALFRLHRGAFVISHWLHSREWLEPPFSICLLTLG